MINQKRKKLLLHCCCAPCATHPSDLLKNYYEITGFFYNPNIYPEEEYILRREEIKKLGQEWEIPVMVGRYDKDRWYERVRGHEKDPEGGMRCAICYRMRLEETAGTAYQNGFDTITTTLSISPYKRADMINRIGLEVVKDYGLRFHEADFKKKDGFKHSCQISERFGFYRQNYCGCEFSMKDR